jgi:radical SAM superfamily enzyme YgiQ (UPF0313 family)
MLNVCLIYLPKPYLKQPDAQQPLGLLYIAASILREGRSVIVKNYTSFSYPDLIADLPQSLIFGITATSLEIPEVNRVSKLIKIKYPESKIIIGGPGTCASEYIDFDYIDSIVVGEGEEVIKEIMLDVDINRLKSFYPGNQLGNQININKIPFPSRHLLKKQGGNIFAFDKNYKGTESAVILFSRGCPYQCAFCSAPKLNNNKVRYRNPGLVAEEIQQIIYDYGIYQFRFSDDMFTLSKKRVIELCDKIGKLGIFWRVSCRTNPIDEEMLQIMYDAGCKELSFGVESFDDNVLIGLKKNATAKDNIQAIDLAKKIGFTTRILFMIRTPFQTEATIQINKHYIERLPFDIIACTAFIPIPGCDIWYHPEKYDIEILDRDLDKYNFYMYDQNGRRKIEPIIKIKNRSLEDFHKESEDFRDWIEEIGKVNKG